MIGRNSKWNMSTADDSRQISSIVEKENGKTFVGAEEMSGEFIITKPVVRGEEGGGRRVRTACHGSYNKLERKEKIIKERKPPLCLSCSDARI